MVDKYSSGLLDVITQFSGGGSVETSVGSSFWGIDNNGSGLPIPANTDQYGLTLFTRPRLNLTYDNVKLVRTLTPLLNSNDLSIPRAIRAYLDPVGSQKIYPSRLVDPLNPFIPILTNTLLSFTGWPDPYMDVYTSKAGVYREQFSMIDGFANMHEAYDLSATFKNMVGDPVGMLLWTITQYAALVHEGEIDPYPSHIFENEIDYNMRAWRFILDPSRRYIQRIGCCGAGFWKSSNAGAAFNYNSDKQFNQDLDQISGEFRIMGAMYNDPILIYEFNKLVTMFNPSMADGTRQNTYVRLDLAHRKIFNYMAYPRIERRTMELEWWVPKDVYLRIRSGVTSLTNLPGLLENPTNTRKFT